MKLFHLLKSQKIYDALLTKVEQSLLGKSKTSLKELFQDMTTLSSVRSSLLQIE